MVEHEPVELIAFLLACVRVEVLCRKAYLVERGLELDHAQASEIGDAF